MHLTDEQLAAMASSERDASAAAVAHVASCPRCSARLDELRVEYREVESLLRQLDHRPPAVKVETVMAAGRRRTWLAGGPIAAGVALCVAAAAAAMPSSPLHQALVRAFTAARTPVAAPATANRDTAPSSIGTGIAIVPGPELDVRFRSRQAQGQLTITFADGPQLSLVPHGGIAAFSVSRGQVSVDNEGSVADYTLVVPRTVRNIRVHVDTVVLFRMSAGAIQTLAHPNGTGDYVVDLALPATIRSLQP